MDKPLKEITVGEWKALCDKRTKKLREEGRQSAECDGCPMSSICAQTPDEWDLSEETFATDTNVGHKTAKPRLAEVLGVEVGELFKVEGVSVSFFVSEDGMPKIYDGDDGLDVEGVSIYKAINHPESIIRAPRLTEAELAICKDVGAKWVSKNKCGARRVTLWDAKPIFDEGMFSITEDDEHSVTIGVIGRISDVLFPSVHPGDCICVEEAGGDA